VTTWISRAALLAPSISTSLDSPGSPWFVFSFPQMFLSNRAYVTSRTTNHVNLESGLLCDLPLSLHRKSGTCYLDSSSPAGPHILICCSAPRIARTPAFPVPSDKAANIDRLPKTRLAPDAEPGYRLFHPAGHSCNLRNLCYPGIWVRYLIRRGREPGNVDWRRKRIDCNRASRRDLSNTFIAFIIGGFRCAVALYLFIARCKALHFSNETSSSNQSRPGLPTRCTQT